MKVCMKLWLIERGFGWQEQPWQLLGRTGATDGYCLVCTMSASTIFNILSQLVMNIWIQNTKSWIFRFLVKKRGDLPPRTSHTFPETIRRSESGFTFSTPTAVGQFLDFSPFLLNPEFHWEPSLFVLLGLCLHFPLKIKEKWNVLWMHVFSRSG